MGETSRNQVKGIKIRTFNTCMIALSCLIFVCLICNTITMPGQYRTFITGTEDYIVCETDAARMSTASDYLTEQVRLYVENMDIRYMENYFTEVNVTRRRENALAELQQHETSQSVQDSLEAALCASNDLMDREIYAMKLISVANGYTADALPAEVRAVQLKAADAALTPDEMIEKARMMVFDTGYQDAKALIKSHLDHFTEGLLNGMAAQQQASEKELENSLSFQRVLIFILFILNIITFVVITVLIVRPLTIHIKRIKENGLLEITGSYEFKYLALTYNDIYELNAANQAVLESKAEHDPLTGLMNRGGFDNLRRIMKDSTVPLALIIADVDTFKQVNDRHGHEVGDRMLQKVSALLTHTFRASDYVVRLGGDEFAVVMPEMKPDHLPVLEKKVKMMNDLLQNSSDGLPPTTMSVGVAFSAHGFPEELFGQADQALYYVKKHGRCGCHAWGVDETEVKGSFL